MNTLITIKVVPNARKSEIVEWRGNLDAKPALRIRLAAPPVDGKANEELIRFLSGILGTTRKQISIGRGEKSRDKVVEIAGLEVEDICQRLKAAIPKPS